MCTPVYGPSCAIPSCASAPVVGFGSCGYGSGTGTGFSGYGYPGAAVPASSLGTVRGAHVACVNQIPSSQVVIKPPPCVLTIPGAVLSASCEPVTVGGYSPCAAGGPGRRGGYWNDFGGICRPGRKYSICDYPC